MNGYFRIALSFFPYITAYFSTFGGNGYSCAPSTVFYSNFNVKHSVSNNFAVLVFIN